MHSKNDTFNNIFSAKVTSSGTIEWIPSKYLDPPGTNDNTTLQPYYYYYEQPDTVDQWYQNIYWPIKTNNQSFDKGKLAIKIAKTLIEKKIIKIDIVGDFVKLVDTIVDAIDLEV